MTWAVNRQQDGICCLTCRSCYLSCDRLIDIPVINWVFSLSCPWEDLFTYSPKINTPNQWRAENIHPRLLTSSFVWEQTATGRVWLEQLPSWEEPGWNQALALAPVPFVRLVLAHISLKESTTLKAQMLKQLHYDLPAATLHHSIVLKVS